MKNYRKNFGDRIEWRNANGQLHREDGPAVEYANGDKYWYINGKFHREDGPAIEWANDQKEWYINGKCHREDGPAIECASGDKLWYINNNHLSESRYAKWQKFKRLLNNAITDIERQSANLLMEAILKNENFS